VSAPFLKAAGQRMCEIAPLFLRALVISPANSQRGGSAKTARLSAERGDQLHGKANLLDSPSEKRGKKPEILDSASFTVVHFETILRAHN
jgi:hypothetical protein